MKTLLLLRHAKSSWAEPDESDHDRPLNDRGKRDAPRVGEFLRDEHLKPDVVLSSTAKRARKTARKALKASGFNTELELVEEFYLATPAAYISKLKGLPDRVDCVLVVGHNPGMAELLETLTQQEHDFPTAALAVLELPVGSWSEFELDTPAKLISFWTPKQ